MKFSSLLRFTAALSLLALPARAGVHYRFQTEGRGGLLPVNRSGSVFIEGGSVRIETRTEDFETISVREDGAKECFILDPARKTYYRSACGRDDAVPIVPIVPSEPTKKEPKVSKVKVEGRDEGPAGLISGLEVRKGTIDVSYITEARMGNDSFPVTIQRRLEVWMSNRLSVPSYPFGHSQELKSGVPEVDARVSEWLKKLGSFPLKHVVTTTRAFDKAHPITETQTTTLSGVEEKALQPSLFQLPPGYRFEEPVIKLPGGH